MEMKGGTNTQMKETTSQTTREQCPGVTCASCEHIQRDGTVPLPCTNMLVLRVSVLQSCCVGDQRRGRGSDEIGRVQVRVIKAEKRRLQGLPSNSAHRFLSNKPQRRHIWIDFGTHDTHAIGEASESTHSSSPCHMSADEACWQNKKVPHTILLLPRLVLSLSLSLSRPLFLTHSVSKATRQ